MASSPPGNSLTELQKELLAAFFDREKGFFLTGAGRRFAHVLAMCAAAASSALVSCGTSCTEDARTSFGFGLKDARTRALICDADVTARDGSYAERLFPVKGGCSYQGPVERSGHYFIHIARDGYLPQDVEVTVARDECHVIPESFFVDLVPTPGS